MTIGLEIVCYIVEWKMEETTEQSKAIVSWVTGERSLFFCAKIVFTFIGSEGLKTIAGFLDSRAIVFHSPHPMPKAIGLHHKAIGLHTQSVHVDFPHLASPHLTKAIVIPPLNDRPQCPKRSSPHCKAIGLHCQSDRRFGRCHRDTDVNVSTPLPKPKRSDSTAKAIVSPLHERSSSPQ